MQQTVGAMITSDAPPAADAQRWADVLGAGGTVEQILTRCGYRCDLCLAFRPNVAAKPVREQGAARSSEKRQRAWQGPQGVIGDAAQQ